MLKKKFTSKQLRIPIEGTILSASSNEPWCHVSPKSGSGDGTLMLSFDENLSDSSRDAIVYVESTQKGFVKKIQITVTQYKSGEEPKNMSISTSTLTFDYNGSSQTVTVTSDTIWTVSSDKSWCTVSPSSSSNDGSFTVTCTQNSGDSQRTATVTVSGTQAETFTIRVTQNKQGEGPSPGEDYLNVSPTSFVEKYESHTIIISISSNVSWTVSSNLSWCKITSSKSGLGNATVTVSLDENTGDSQRTAEITVSGNNQDINVNVTLNAIEYELEVFPERITISEWEGGDMKFFITSNGPWTVSKDSEWLSFDPVSGDGDGTVTVTAGKNSDTGQRTGNISVTCGSIGKNISVTQTSESQPIEKYLEASTESIEFTSKQGEYVLGISSNVNWTVDPYDEWITTQTSTGSGNAQIIINVTKNEEDDKREGMVIIIGEQGMDPLTINVTQSGKVADVYTIGIISDIHYCITSNKKIQTESDGNGASEYGKDSYFREDLNKLIQKFKELDVDFVASPGDIVTYDVNDFVEFTHDYIKDFTGLDVYTGDSFLSNDNYRPFYCAMGNHDHFVNYADNSLCKYINYGVSDAGTRWNSITYGSTTYNCPGALKGTGVTYASSDSMSYRVTHGEDIFIFLQPNYGPTLVPHNPNFNNKNDMSQMHPHNLLNRNDSDVQAMMTYCGKTDIFDSATESNFNFQYFLPADLIWLKNQIQANSTKRIFIFLHYFFAHKAGSGNMYEVGSTEMMGLTFHFLNKLNNDYKKTVWFTGHSHFSWKELAYDNAGDIHFCNADHPYITPTADENSTILSSFNNSNYYAPTDERKLYNRDNSTVIKSGTGWNVHIPSMSRPKDKSSQMADCEAAIMEVHKDHVEIYKIGYTTLNGTTYSSYEDSICYHSLTINNDGNGTISGPTPGGGGAPDPGILTDNCIEMSVDNTGSFTNYNSHIRLEFEEGGYLHVYCGGQAENGVSEYGGRYSPKYNFTGGWGWGSLLIFVGDSIPEKFRYLAYHWGLLVKAEITSDPNHPAWIYTKESPSHPGRNVFFSEDKNQVARAYYGSVNGDPNNNPHWLVGDDLTEFINSMKDVLRTYQGKKIKSNVLVYYYDSNKQEKFVNGTLTDVRYYDPDSKTIHDSIGLYFVNGKGDNNPSKNLVRYIINFPT